MVEAEVESPLAGAVERTGQAVEAEPWPLKEEVEEGMNDHSESQKL